MFLTVALSLFLQASGSSPAPSRGSELVQADLRGSTTAGAIEPPEVALSAVRAARGQWLGREVRFTLQIESQVEHWNPWLTRFSEKLYRGFRAWSDEGFLWRHEDFDDVAPRLFVRRGTEAEGRLATAARYERFRVRARVCEVFLDEPWIEVLEAELLPERVGEGTILHAVRGLELLAEGRPQLAASELERAARVPLLPAHVARELSKLREACNVGER